MNYKSLGSDMVQRIDSVLKLKGVKRQTLASIVGFSEPNIARWKTQGSLPDFNVGLQIARYLDVSPEWLLYGDDSNGLSGEDATYLAKLHNLLPEDREIVMLLADKIKERYDSPEPLSNKFCAEDTRPYAERKAKEDQNGGKVLSAKLSAN